MAPLPYSYSFDQEHCMYAMDGLTLFLFVLRVVQFKISFNLILVLKIRTSYNKNQNI